MTPKEKAKELVDRCYIRTQYQLRSFPDAWESAKQCAIICVEEILALNTVWFDKSASLEEDESDTTEYWEEVKQEIQQL